MFSTKYRVRINDINYGGHLGAAQLGLILHDARVRFLHDQMGYKDELHINGFGLILTADEVKLLNEAFYGESLTITIDTKLCGAKLLIDYLVCVEDKKIATSKVELRFFDYENKKVVRPPKEFQNKLFALKEIERGNNLIECKSVT